MNRSRFNKVLKGICTLGKGKGKIVFGSKRFVFSYDSAFQSQDSWGLEVSVPFRGSEYMKVQNLNGKMKFSGSFYALLKSNFRSFSQSNPAYNEGDLKKLLAFTAGEIFRIQKFKKELKNNSQSYFSNWCATTPVDICTQSFNGVKYEVESHQTQVIRKSRQYSLSWTNRAIGKNENSFFKQSIFKLFREGEELLEASFYPTRCQNDSI